MNKEIKEILEFDFQSQGERIEINEYERDILKDYITNLQKIEKDHQRINGELRQQLKQTEELAMEYKEKYESSGVIIEEGTIKVTIPIPNFENTIEELDKTLDFRSSDK